MSGGSERERLAEEMYVATARARHSLGLDMDDELRAEFRRRKHITFYDEITAAFACADAALAHVAEERDVMEREREADQAEIRANRSVIERGRLDWARIIEENKTLEQERARLVAALREEHVNVIAVRYPQLRTDGERLERHNKSQPLCPTCALLADPAAATPDATGGGA